MKKNSGKLFVLWIVATILLQGCANTTNLWGEGQAPEVSLPQIFSTDTPTVTATILPTETSTPTATSTPTLTPTITLTPTELPASAKIKHVIIVSYDGLRGDAVEKAPMTNLMYMMQNGSYTLKARTINYAVTLPAHASMLSGLCQSKHGVDWDVTTYYKGYSKGVDIFDEAHAAGLKTVMVVNKEKLRQLVEPETTDVFKIVYGTEAVIMKTAIEQIPQGFDLMFVHFGSPDNRGHKSGWMSNAYMKALRDGDAALGLLLASLDEYHIRDSTLIIVSADHGGHDRMHVGTVIEDLLIPWVIYGPGVLPNHELTNPVSIMDTAPTVAYALELPSQSEWDGLPVFEAFGLPSPDVHPENMRICK